MGRVKKLGTGYLETAKVKIPGRHFNLNFGGRRCSGGGSFFDVIVNTNGGLEVVTLFKVCPARVDADKTF